MADLNEKLHEEIEELRQVRDELRVKLHLGKAEIAERWDEVEKKWSHLEAKAKQLKEESQDSLEEIGSAAKLLAEEVRKGFANLRERI